MTIKTAIASQIKQTNAILPNPKLVAIVRLDLDVASINLFLVPKLESTYISTTTLKAIKIESGKRPSSLELCRRALFVNEK